MLQVKGEDKALWVTGVKGKVGLSLFALNED